MYLNVKNKTIKKIISSRDNLIVQNGNKKTYYNNKRFIKLILHFRIRTNNVKTWFIPHIIANIKSWRVVLLNSKLREDQIRWIDIVLFKRKRMNLNISLIMLINVYLI